MTGHWISIDRTEKPSLSVPLRTDGHWAVDGLVGWWDFTEGAGRTHFDRSGNGNDGTQQNTSWTSFWTAGEYGGAGVFDGSNDYISVSDDDSLDIAANEDFTLFFEGSLDDFSQRSGLLAKRASGSGAIPQWSWEVDTSGKSRLFIKTSGTSATSIATNAISADTPVRLFLAVDRSGNATHYTDGEANGSSSVSSQSGSLATSTVFEIAAANITQTASATKKLKGKGSRFGIWRRLLSAEEIAEFSANPNQIYQPHAMFVPGAAGVGGGTIPLFYYYYAMMRSQ